jgi:hypothetical protein
MHFLMDSPPYAFDVAIHDDEDEKLHMITFVSRQKQPFPCVELFVPFQETKDDHAKLRMLNYAC